MSFEKAVVFWPCWGILYVLMSANSGAFDPPQSESSGDAQATENPLEGNPDAIKAGAALYSNTCLFCHGPNGVGARAPTLVAGAFEPGGANDDEYMFDIISNGRPGTIMGGFAESYTDEQIWQVISYLRSEAQRIAGGDED